MTTEENYIYCSNVISILAVIFFILFLLVQFGSTYIYKVYITQSLLTISLSLFILSFILRNGFEQRELDKPLFYFTFILAIPLLYHILFYLFFQNDIVTRLKFLKIYILFGFMVYLTLIWYNTKNLSYVDSTDKKVNDMIIDALKVATIYY
jgi:hypothetical protein